MPEPPWTEVERLLVIGTGAASVAFLPYWMNMLHVTHPGLKVRVVVTSSAQRFVTLPALEAAGATTVQADAWPPPGDGTASHVEFSEWAEAMIVYPASYHFVARLALGLGDTPALLAAQCTRAPIAVAPAPPPGGTDSECYRSHVSALRARERVTVVDPLPARSITTGRQDAWTPAPLPEALASLGTGRARRTSPKEAVA